VKIFPQKNSLAYFDPRFSDDEENYFNVDNRPNFKFRIVSRQV